MTEPELHNRLKTLRQARGLTQADLAEAVGVSRKTVNTVENRVFTPSTLLALKMARVLGVPVEDVFSLEPFDGPQDIDAKGDAR
jgi:putative transcriptional regulator